MDTDFYNRVNGDRITTRQIDELIGISRGLIADGQINEAEIDFLQKWLVSNSAISDQPIIRTLYTRIKNIFADKIIDSEEKADLFDALQRLSDRDFELGEMLKPTTLPLCDPAPELSFQSIRYCFTGTFGYGQRRTCEQAVIERGGVAGSLTQKTDILVIGMYVTESWKHSAFGNKIMQACEWRDEGYPISIVCEEHWCKYL